MRELTFSHVFESCPDCRFRGTDVFSNNDLQAFGVVSTYAPGQALFLEGDKARGAYIILHGVVRLQRSAASPAETFVKIAGPGDAASIAPLFAGRTHALSARAVDITTVQFIERRTVLHLLARNSGRWQQALEAIHRTHRIHPRNVDPAAIVRLSDYILRSAGEEARSMNSLDVGLELTTRELALLLHLKVATLQEAAAEIERRHVLFFRGHRVAVTNIPTLEQIIDEAERRERVAS